MSDRWQLFSDEELSAISSALWTTSAAYPMREDYEMLVALREETTPIVKRREARVRSSGVVCDYCGHRGHGQPGCVEWMRDECTRMSIAAKRERSVAFPNGPERRESQTRPGSMTFTTMTTRGN